MLIFGSYQELLESNIVDRHLFQLFVSRQALLTIVSLLCYYQNLFILIPFLTLYLKSKIHSFTFRRLLTAAGILVCWYFGSFWWILLLIEVLRSLVQFGFPFFLRRVSEEMPRDAVGETALKRAVELLRRARTQAPLLSWFQWQEIYSAYTRKDDSDPFTEEERQKCLKFFREFERSCLVVDSSEITLFLPSFVLRSGREGIHLTSDEAIRLIRGSEEICPICLENMSRAAIELNCGHHYCLKCIFEWLNQQYSCPLCRREVK